MIEIVNTLKGILSVLEDIAEALTPADDSKATKTPILPKFGFKAL